MKTKKALEGVKIADFSWVAVGPVTTSYLGDSGATVVKIESHTYPDNSRVVGPFKGQPSLDTSGFFTHQNSSKYSVTLNLAKPKGREVALKLINWADVMTESMLPGAMKRLGLDYESVRKVKPDIIYFSTSMHGQYGPRCFSPGYGQLGCGLAGIYNLSGWPDRGPAPPEGAYLDFISPRFGVMAIMAALDYHRRTGKGQYIDMALIETALHFVAPLIIDYSVNGRLPVRQGNRCDWAAPHGAFPCEGDNRWIAIAVRNDDEWKGLCKVMGQPSWSINSKFATLLARKQNESELESHIKEWTMLHKAEELMEKLQAAGVPSSVVESNRDLFEDPQLEHRGHFKRLEHPVMGTYAHDSRAFRLSKTPDNQFAAPAMGQHNEYVLKELLGLSEDEFADLLAEGAITTEADLPKKW